MLPTQALLRLVISLVAILTAPAEVTSSYTPALPEQLYKARPGVGRCVNCTRTIVGLNRSVTEKIELERIKDRIMRKLGLKNIPGLAAESLTTSEVRKSEVNVSQTPKEDQSSMYQYIDIISKAEPPDGINDKSVLQFKVEEKKKEDGVGVHRGYLYVFLKKRGKKSKGNKRITLRISTVNDKGKPDKLLTSLKMRLKESKWQKIGLPSDLLNGVLKNPSSPLKLHVRCKKCKKSVKPILLFKSNKNRRKPRKGRTRKQHRNRSPSLNKKRPLIVIHTRTLRTRSKRHTLSCVRGSGAHDHPHNASILGETNNSCCKRSYYLNFTDIGWDDWIISPEGTVVAECNGRCSNRRPTAFLDSVTSHGQPASRGRRQRNRQCRPTRNSPLVMVYFNESLHVVQRRIPDMIVSSCGCRQAN